MGLDSLRRWRNLAGTKIPCCLGGLSNFEKKTQGLESSRQEHQALPRGQLVQCICANWRCHTRACTRRTSRGELDQDDGQRDKKQESEDQPEELRRVLEARQPTELERQKHSQMNHAKALEIDEQGIVEARTIWTQNLLRFLLHERGRSFDANACIDIQQIREDGCHSFGTERIDAVRSEILCRLHSANWSSNVHQQE